MDRRTSLQWILAASAGMSLGPMAVGGEELAASTARPSVPTPNAAPMPPTPRGYGTDPDLAKIYHPGELWPLTLTDAQRHTAAVLCDLIIPGDERSPSASAVGVVDFLDEWVSAPYPRQRGDRSTLLEGLTWIDAEAGRRFGRAFAALGGDQQRAIADDICYEVTAQPPFADAARFFARFRDLTAGGFYSSPAGRQDLGYMGNVPRRTFERPAPEVLRKLGLEGVDLRGDPRGPHRGSGGISR